MSLLASKLKFKQNLVDSIKQEEEEKQTSGGRKNDPRFLNFYDLEFGQSMRLLLVPDVNGELFLSYAEHGPKLDAKMPHHTLCPRVMSNAECVICNEKMFPLYEMGKDAGANTDAGKQLKAMANRFQTSDRCIASCIVLESPVEIPLDESLNQVKLFRVPKDVEKAIRNALKMGEISQSDLTVYPLVLTKNKNAYDKADYSGTVFSRKPISDDDEAWINDQETVIELYDYEALENFDFIPSLLSSEEMLEWIETADAAIKTADDKKARAAAAGKAGPAGAAGKKTNVKDDARARIEASKSRHAEESTTEAEEPTQAETTKAEVVESQKPTDKPQAGSSTASVSSMREKLASLRK